MNSDQCTCTSAHVERWGEHGNLCPLFKPCICTMGKHTRKNPNPGCPVHATDGNAVRVG